MAARLVNAPLPLVVAPILILLIVPATAGLIVTVPVPVGCKLTAAFDPSKLTAPVAVSAPVPMLPELIFPLTPTPPVTTNVPVAVSVLAVLAVRVVAPLAVSVVNAPVLAFVAPIVVLLIDPPVIVALLLTKLPRNVPALKSPNVPLATSPVIVASGMNSKYPSAFL